jgi:phosphatidylglycerophosphate synthase
MKKHAANIISVSRVAFLLPLYFLLKEESGFSTWVGSFLILFSFTLDGLDGYLARRFGSVSYLGSFLDLLFDRLSEIVLFAFIITGPYGVLVPKLVLIAFFFRIIITDICRIGMYYKGILTPQGPKLYGVWKSLNLSYLSRGGYSVFKAFYFIIFLFGFNFAFSTPQATDAVANCLNAVLLTYSIIRSIPIVVKAMRSFHASTYDQQYNLTNKWKTISGNALLFIIDCLALLLVALR